MLIGIIVVLIRNDVMLVNFERKLTEIKITLTNVTITLAENKAIPTRDYLIYVRKSSNPTVFVMALVNLGLALTRTNVILSRNAVVPVGISLLFIGMKLILIGTGIKKIRIKVNLISN